MNLTQLRDNTVKQLPTIIFSLVGIVGLVALWYTYRQRYQGYTEVIVFLVVLLLFVTLLVGKVEREKILTTLLIFCHITLAILWGSAVPFVHFLPFIIAFLLTKQQKVGYIYFFFALILQLAEISGITPYVKLDIDVGFTNLFVIFVLQITLYTIFSVLLELFNDFSENAINLPGKFSRYSLSQLLLQGLYASLLLHFTNNVINSHIWTRTNTELPSGEILELFAVSNNSTAPMPLKKLIATLHAYFEKCKTMPLHFGDIPDVALPPSTFQLLLISLFDLLTNYYKHGNYSSVLVAITQESNKITTELTGTATSNQNGYPTAKPLKQRHLSKLKLFLKLTRQGSAQLALDNDRCVTTLTIVMPPQ